VGGDHAEWSCFERGGSYCLAAGREAATSGIPTSHRRGGVFTGLLVDALSGGAANLVGDVTPGSVYAHIDQSLGP